MAKEKENQITAALLTIIICGLLLLFMIFLGLQRPFPPPPEYGVEVNLGNSNDGMGNEQPESVDAAVNAAQQPSHTPNTENIASAANENYTNIKPTRQQKPQQPVQQQNQPQSEEKPVLNPLASYTKPRTSSTANTAGSNEGITGRPGDQGVEGGTPGAANYSGTPGRGKGIGFDLTGRTSKNLAKPNYNSDEQGKVVVKIWVNQEGNVTRAEAGMKGTTTTDATLWKMSEQAAMRSSFSPKQDAPEIQTGTITYHFVKLN